MQTVETPTVEDPNVPQWFESPGAFKQRTGMGIDRAWRVWNETQEKLSRREFRDAVKDFESDDLS